MIKKRFDEPRKKIMRAFLKTLIAIVIVVTVFIPGAKSQGGNAALEREAAEAPAITLEPGTYTVKANLVLEREKYTAASKSLGLEWPKKNTLDFDPSLPGWVAKDSAAYFWTPGEDKSFLDIPLSFNPDSSAITDFDELHIDYQDFFTENPTHLSLDIALSGVRDPADISGNAKGGERRLKVGGERVLKVDRKKLLTTIDTLDITSVPWIMKDYLYVAKRIIGLPFDTYWRYNQQGVDTFFQRRLHKDLDPIETLDLVFQPDTMPLKIRSQKRIIEMGKRLFACNLRIGFGSRLKPVEIVPCSSLPTRVIKNTGRQILQVEVGALVRDYRERGEKAAFLEEIIIHLPQQKAQQVMEHPPLEKIIFQEWDKPQKEEWLKSQKPKETIPVMTLFSKTEDLPGTSKRLVLNLRDLARQVGKNPTVGRINLSIQPDDPEKRSGIHLHRAEMVKLTDDERYLFLGAGERLNRQWGGPFFKPDNKDKVEWVKVDSYLSLANRGWEKTGGSISVGGGEVPAGAPSSVWRSTDNGLEIEGQGKWVEMDWPIHARMGEATRFYLDMPEGAESVLGMRVEPRYHGQALSPVETFPNLPVKIHADEIDGIKVHLKLDGKPFHLVLKEMALFQPVVLAPVEALDIPQPADTLVDPASNRVPTSVEMRSVHDDLTRYPVMQWNGRKFLYPDSAPAADLFVNDHWVALGFLSIENNSALVPSYPRHPYLHIQKIVFEKSGLSGDAKIFRSITESRQDMEPKTFSEVPRWAKFLFIVFAIMALRWVWGREYWARPETRETLNGRFSRAQTALLNLYRQTLPLTTLINRLSGLMVIGLGFWAMQVFDDPGVRSPVLWIAALFLLCVFWHELRGRSRRDKPSVLWIVVFGGNKEIPYVLRFAALVVIGWIVWQAGHRAVGQGTSGIWLPLIFLGYLYLPWLERSIVWLLKRSYRLWLVMATGFYVLGLLTTVTRSENYYFTFGSVAVVFAWRGLMLFARPKLEIKWPTLADKIYDSPGTLHIAGFILALIGATLVLLVNLEQVAEQLTIIGYYMLVIGLILEVGVLRKQQDAGRSTTTMPAEATGA